MMTVVERVDGFPHWRLPMDARELRLESRSDGGLQIIQSIGEPADP